MKKLFLHIGPHKTGSTYIQKSLHDNRVKLKSFGVNYPDVEINKQYGHHQIVEFINQCSKEELTQRLNEILSDQINILSSENFDRLNKAEVSKLKFSLANYDVKVIYYYRHYAELLPSWWQESVKHGSRASFYQFLLPHILKPLSSSIINPDVVLDVYSQAFGKSNINVIDYDSFLKSPNIVKPLIDFIGLDMQIGSKEVVNKSLKLEDVELIRVLNIIAFNENKLKGSNMRDIYLRNIKSLKSQGYVCFLIELISQSIKKLSLAGGFFESAANSRFKKNYADCLYKGNLEVHVDQVLRVPNDEWLLNSEAYSNCKKLYLDLLAA